MQAGPYGVSVAQSSAGGTIVSITPIVSAARRVLLLAVCGLSCTMHAQSLVSNFALHDGDRVTFYGDSITDQRQYTEDVEEYVLTRYPNWKVSFHNAGVGGDTVSGGWAGPVDYRLDRDVFAWHPDVITIMLGMNDFNAQPDQPGIYSSYTEGYRHIVESLQKNLPRARITLIQPSPFDDVTREVVFPGGSNAVLLKYGGFIAQLARERGTQLADFNAPVIGVLKTINTQSPALAPQVIPDRVHPQQGAHWVMAESLLKSWQAPSLVTSVVIDAGTKPSADATNAEVNGLIRSRGRITSKISWTQSDKALPLPFPPAEVDPVLALVVKDTDIVAALDQETLQVRSLTPGTYDLLIDGRKIGAFKSDGLANGINLATIETPMLEQAWLVAFDTEKVNELESERFTIVSVYTTAEQSATAQALTEAYLKGVERQRLDAHPLPHRYDLVLEGP
jgi:lysophospholipase L1-like esterase